MHLHTGKVSASKGALPQGVLSVACSGSGKPFALHDPPKPHLFLEASRGLERESPQARWEPTPAS